MLDSRSDRLDYGEILQPPEGHRMDYALAATYSADLSTVLSIPVALIYAKTLEGDFSDAGFELLDAIESFSERVRVFHQVGRLHLPKRWTRLFAHLESVFVPVQLDNAYATFHPKIWVIRYVNDQDESIRQYRVIVLSRNLTFDRSWDVAAVLDGQVGKSAVETAAPLVQFIEYLKGFLPEEDPCSWLAEFLDELRRTSFEIPRPFESFAFHPVGPGLHSHNPALSVRAHDGLVMSPFVHRETLKRLRSNVESGLVLVSEPQELRRIPNSVLKTMDRVWHLREEIVSSEQLIARADGTGDAQFQHLHAKVFLFWSGKNYGRTTMFLGSANATEAADGRNVEFVLELQCPRGYLNQQSVQRELFGDAESNGPFRIYDIQDDEISTEQDDWERELRQFEYELLKAPCDGYVEHSRNSENYDLCLQFDLQGLDRFVSFEITVRPLTVGASIQDQALRLGVANAVTFGVISEVDLTRFFVFRIESDEKEHVREYLRLVRVRGMPTERLSAIRRKIVDSREKFFAYLRFLIAPEIRKEDLLVRLENEEQLESGSHESSSGWHADLPVFEEMLVAASRSPHKIKKANRVIQELIRQQAKDRSGESVVPPDFADFWAVFQEITE